VVKNDKDIVYVSSVENDVVCFHPMINDQFLEILKQELGGRFETGDSP
jgi:hypothetical protein